MKKLNWKALLLLISTASFCPLYSMQEEPGTPEMPMRRTGSTDALVTSGQATLTAPSTQAPLPPRASSDGNLSSSVDPSARQEEPITRSSSRETLVEFGPQTYDPTADLEIVEANKTSQEPKALAQALAAIERIRAHEDFSNRNQDYKATQVELMEALQTKVEDPTQLNRLTLGRQNSFTDKEFSALIAQHTEIAQAQDRLKAESLATEIALTGQKDQMSKRKATLEALIKKSQAEVDELEGALATKEEELTDNHRLLEQVVAARGLNDMVRDKRQAVAQQKEQELNAIAYKLQQEVAQIEADIKGLAKDTDPSVRAAKGKELEAKKSEYNAAYKALGTHRADMAVAAGNYSRVSWGLGTYHKINPIDSSPSSPTPEVTPSDLSPSSPASEVTTADVNAASSSADKGEDSDL